MPRSRTRKILLCYPTLDLSIWICVPAPNVNTANSFRLSFVYLLFIFFTSLSTDVSAQSWNDKINLATDSQNTNQVQIENLKRLLPELENTPYQDTIGFVYYFMAWRYTYLNHTEDALKAATTSIKQFIESGYSGYRLPYMYKVRADHYKALGKDELAIADAESIASLTLSGRGIEILGESIRMIAQIYSERGEYQSAISQLEYTLSSESEIKLSPYSLANIYYDLSVAYSNFSDSLYMQKANVAIHTSNEYISQLEYEDEKLNQKIINGLHAGNIAFRQSRIKEAADYYEASRILIPTDNRTLDQHRYYETLTANLIYAYELLEKPSKVDSIISAADMVNSQLIPEELKAHRTVVYENIASYYRRIGSLQNAELYIDSLFQVLDLNLSKGFYEKPIHSMPYKKRVIKGLLESIHIQKRREEISGKADHLSVIKKMNLIDNIIDAVNQELLFESSVLQWREDAQKYYKIGIDLAFAADDHEAFWNYAEKSKSLALLDEISNNELFSQQDNVSLSVSQLRQLRIQESQLLAQDQSIDSIQINLISNRQQQSDLLRKRDAIFKKKIPEVTSIDRMISLAGNYSLIHYISGVDVLYAIVIQNGKSNIYDIGDNSTIQKLSLQVFNSLKSPPVDSEVNSADSGSALNQLYKLLISKIGTLNKELLIIPEGNLAFIPFEALVEEYGQYLLFNHDISYQLSGTLYSQMLNQKRSSVDRSVVVLPDYQKSQFQELTSASEEKELVCKLLSCEIIDSLDISKHHIYHAISHSDIFHYAGHAVIGTHSGEDTYLAISDSVRISEKEIYNLPNHLQLVTLSACETGLGEILLGEGISNLSRGFIYSGTQAIVQSLWQVNDGSSAKLMELFYEQLRHGVSKSEALRKAKIAYINIAEDFQRAPYYWSSFVLIGNDDPLSFTSISYSIFFWGALVFAMIILTLSLYKYFRRLSN